MVEAVLKLDGLKGLVLETFGAGNAPGGPDGALTKVFADAVKRGIVIVNVTQCKTSQPHLQTFDQLPASWRLNFCLASSPCVCSLHTVKFSKPATLAGDNPSPQCQLWR